MEFKVYSVEGKEIKTIDLDDSVFAAPVNDSAVYYAVNGELKNRRVGTASTKERSEVRGSTKKPWRQKGTGRARAGRRSSPIWVGGGVVFGPRPRDFSVKLPRKLKQSAFRSLLSMKSKEDTFRIVEDFEISSGKTREMQAILSRFYTSGKTVLVLPDENELLKRSCRNIPTLKFFTYNRLSAHALFYGENLFLLESTAVKLAEFYKEAKHGA